MLGPVRLLRTLRIETVMQEKILVVPVDAGSHASTLRSPAAEKAQGTVGVMFVSCASGSRRR